MARSLAAWTSSAPVYPPFFNISEDAGEIRVTVRAEAGPTDGRVLMPGAQATMFMPLDVAIAQLKQALAELETA